MKTTPEYQEEDDPEEEQVDLKEEEEEEKDGLGMGSELQHPEEKDNLLRGVEPRARAGSSVSSRNLSPESFEDRKAERELEL
ncbi:hypothetical protein NDU88_002443 [Pleurodeles waltl]|uniref:Uncharacterized protein n=1 Tax=Pleurodeles waltl TaxID=8319 RepID=A0AAV7SD02_PLEWA|nr:hypothetical protein NDU88_002443 [Pleurodeles waltl]